MMNGQAERFVQAVNALGRAARPLLGTVGEQEMALAGEIRLRVGAPAALSLPAGLKTIGTSPVTRQQMDEMVLSLCGQSVYTHQHELAAGYIHISGGHRAGVCGTAVIEQGRVTSIRDITSICLRIAREQPGCADEIIKRLFSRGLCSAVIAGAPCSGKTTLLRELACQLASGAIERPMRVAVVDERGEIALSSFTGEPGRLNRLCDVLCGYPKAEGILQAVRGLSPDVIICDELGTEEETIAVRAGINAGVHIICSVHAGSAEELARKPQISALMDTGAFSRFALLKGRNRPGEVSGIISGEELYALGGSGADSVVRIYRGNVTQRTASGA